MRGNRRSAVAIDQANDAGAIYRRGNGLAEADVAEPFLLARYFWQPVRIVIQVEQQEVVLKSRPGVIQLEVPRLLLRLQSDKVVRAQPADKL